MKSNKAVSNKPAESRTNKNPANNHGKNEKVDQEEPAESTADASRGSEIELDSTESPQTQLDSTKKPMDVRERVTSLVDDSRAKLQSLTKSVREHAAESLNFHSVEEKYNHLQTMIRSFESGMLLTVAQGSKPRGRPMIIADVQGSGDTLVLWFVSRRASEKVKEVEAESYASVSFQDGGRYLCVNGLARTVDDKHKVALLWKSSWSSWFDGEAATADAILLRIQVQEAEYWDRSGALRARVVYDVARALISGEPVHETENAGDTVTDDRQYGRLSFSAE